MALKRALTVENIEAFKPITLPFAGEWFDAIGAPELTGSWLVYGGSANGKTRFAMQLARYLANFCKVTYDSLEEGLSASMQKTIMETGLKSVSKNFQFLDKEPIADLRIRLKKRGSADVVIIDSLQYSGLNYAEYRALRDEFRKKLFVFISHADGKSPRGRVAQAVKYDAFVKIYIESFKAYVISRFGGGAEYVIWATGAENYGNNNLNR